MEDNTADSGILDLGDSEVSSAAPVGGATVSVLQSWERGAGPKVRPIQLPRLLSPVAEKTPRVIPPLAERQLPDGDYTFRERADAAAKAEAQASWDTGFGDLVGVQFNRTFAATALRKLTAERGDIDPNFKVDPKDYDNLSEDEASYLDSAYNEQDKNRILAEIQVIREDDKTLAQFGGWPAFFAGLVAGLPEGAVTGGVASLNTVRRLKHSMAQGQHIGIGRLALESGIENTLATVGTTGVQALYDDFTGLGDFALAMVAGPAMSAPFLPGAARGMGEWNERATAFRMLDEQTKDFNATVAKAKGNLGEGASRSEVQAEVTRLEVEQMHARNEAAQIIGQDRKWFDADAEDGFTVIPRHVPMPSAGRTKARGGDEDSLLTYAADRETGRLYQKEAIRHILGEQLGSDGALRTPVSLNGGKAKIVSVNLQGDEPSVTIRTEGGQMLERPVSDMAPDVVGHSSYSADQADEAQAAAMLRFALSSDSVPSAGREIYWNTMSEEDLNLQVPDRDAFLARELRRDDAPTMREIEADRAEVQAQRPDEGHVMVIGNYAGNPEAAGVPVRAVDMAKWISGTFLPADHTVLLQSAASKDISASGHAIRMPGGVGAVAVDFSRADWPAVLVHEMGHLILTQGLLGGAKPTARAAMRSLHGDYLRAWGAASAAGDSANNLRRLAVAKGGVSSLYTKKLFKDVNRPLSERELFSSMFDYMARTEFRTGNMDATEYTGVNYGGDYAPSFSEFGAEQFVKYLEAVTAGETNWKPKSIPAVIVDHFRELLVRFANMFRWAKENNVLAPDVRAEEFFDAVRKSRQAEVTKARRAAEGLDPKRHTAATPAPNTPVSKFKQWFGKSVVVNEDGSPMQLYHGTSSDISEFQHERLGSSTGAKSAQMGFFFTNNPEVAGSYAEHAQSNAPQQVVPDVADRLLVRTNDLKLGLESISDLLLEGPGLHDATLALDLTTNGIEALRKGGMSDDEFGATVSAISFNAAKARRYLDTALTRAHLSGDEAAIAAIDKVTKISKEVASASLRITEAKSAESILPVYLRLENPYIHDYGGIVYDGTVEIKMSKIIADAKASGHDGVILRNLSDNPDGSTIIADQYVVFDANQIKSSIGNSGEFSRTDNNITKARTKAVPGEVTDLETFASTDALAMEFGLDHMPMETKTAEGDFKAIYSLYERAKAWEADNPRDLTGFSWLLNTAPFKNGMAAFSVIARSQNPLARMIASELLENPSGAGGKRQTTASLVSFMAERKIMGNTANEFNAAFFAWRRSQGQGRIGDHLDGKSAREFNTLVAVEVESRRMGRQTPNAHENVKHAADALEALYTRSAEEQRAAKTSGWAALSASSKGYMPHKMSGYAVRNLTNDQKRVVQQILADQFMSIEGFDPTFSQRLAIKYLARIEQRALGGASATLNLGHTGAADMVEDALLAMGMNRDDIRKQMEKFTRGAAGHTKARLNLDLLAEHKSVDGNFRLLDLYDVDQLGLARAQSRRVGGEIGLAGFGVMGKPGLDLMRQALEYGRSDGKATQQELDSFDQIAAEFLGTPYGTAGNNKALGRVMQITALTRLGGMGFTQVSETINIAASLGAGRALGFVPAFARMRREVKALAAGKHVDNPIIGSLEKFVGAEFGTDSYKIVIPMDDPNLEYQVNGAGALPWYDRALRAGGYAQGKLSFWRAIHSAQQRYVAESIVDKAMQMIHAGGDDVALADIGIDAGMAKRLKAETGAYKMNNGRLVELDVSKFQDATLARDFAAAVHRGVGQIIQDTFIGERNKWTHDSVARVMTQFRTFSITAIEKQWGRNVNNYGHMKAIGLLLGSMSAVAPIYIVRMYSQALGMEESEREKFLDKALSNYEIGRATMNYVASSGLAGDFLDALVTVSGTGQAIGARSSGGQGGSSFVGNVVAPGLEVIDDTWRAVQNNKDGTDPTGALKALPFSRLPGIIPLINTLGD